MGRLQKEEDEQLSEDELLDVTESARAQDQGSTYSCFDILAVPVLAVPALMNSKCLRECLPAPRSVPGIYTSRVCNFGLHSLDKVYEGVADTMPHDLFVDPWELE